MASNTESNTQPITAAELLDLVRSISERLPVVESVAASPKAARRLANVRDAFIGASFNAVGATDGVANVLGRSEADLRQEKNDSAEWTTAISALNALLSKATEAETRRRHRLGLASLQVYAICKQLVRSDPFTAALAPHVAEMKRVNPFGRKRKSTASEPQPQQQ